MRWQFVDRITRFERWAAIEGRKAVSLEEYSLLEPLGRKGMLPETLVLESCVHLARWLVVASSDFQDSCLLTGADDFAFEREAGAGSSLVMSLTCDPGRLPQLRTQEDGGRTREPDPGEFEVRCVVTDGRDRLAHGDLRLCRIPLGEIAVPDEEAAMWRELYGKA